MTSWRRWLIWGSLVLLALLVFAPIAEARVGGGQSFGGGGSRGGGGGGGDGEGLGLLVYFLIRLCIEQPCIGIPLTAVVIVVGIFVARAKNKEQQKIAAKSQARRASRQGQRLLDKLRQDDPNFSRVVFLDFVHLLYGRAYRATDAAAKAAVEQYFTPEAFRSFPFPKKVDEVIVGSVQLRSVLPMGNWTRVDVEVEANLLGLVTAEGKERGQRYRKEVLTLRRRKGALTKPPEEVRKLGCTSCGAPAERDVNGNCTYCDQPMRPGQDAWAVERRRQLVDRTPRRDELTAGGGDEVGTDRPTLADPRVSSGLRGLRGRDPQFALSDFKQYAAKVFRELQQAWNDRDWNRARPYESDRLFDSHRAFMERYRAERLINKLDDVEVGKVEVAKVEVDAFYESITVRIFASMKDYTVEEDSGKVVAGSKTRARRFSEYWTFVRRAGVKQPGPKKGGCPSCGAELQINQAGMCEYCDALITSGNFYWVLALIEQDEVYGG